jgi:hypothetical protein
MDISIYGSLGLLSRLMQRHRAYLDSEYRHLSYQLSGATNFHSDGYCTLLESSVRTDQVRAGKMDEEGTTLLGE